MTPVRVFLMLTSLLTATAAVNAQSGPPPASSFPYPLVDLRTSPQCCWHVKAWQHTVAVCQRLLAGGNEPMTARRSASPTQAVECGLGMIGNVPCCAARTQPQPLTAEIMKRLAGLHGIAEPQPFSLCPPMCAPAQEGFGIVRVVHAAPAQIKPVRFATPDLDGHCERMSHQGDTVVLEGNVVLLVKKHAQPIRIEAQRVIVNMRDGSFQVTSTASAPAPSNFGIQRTSGLEEPRRFHTTIGNGVRIAVPMMGPVPLSHDLAIPVVPATPSRSSEPTPCPIDAEALFQHLMRYYR
jgi:hypothetical protein